MALSQQQIVSNFINVIVFHRVIQTPPWAGTSPFNLPSRVAEAHFGRGLACAQTWVCLHVLPPGPEDKASLAKVEWERWGTGRPMGSPIWGGSGVSIRPEEFPLRGMTQFLFSIVGCDPLFRNFCVSAKCYMTASAFFLSRK